jgi:hypothetical protein
MFARKKNPRVIGLDAPLRLCAGLLLCGCANLSTAPRTAWRSLDPAAPLGAQGEVQTRRIPESAPTSVLPPLSTPPSTRSDPPQRQELPRSRAKLLPLPKPPRIEPGEVTPGSGFELSIEAPARKQVGSHATYRVTVRNASNQPADDVTVECRFNEPLVFSGSDKRRVVQHFERFLPGESKDLTLSLLSAEVGSHCCRFSVQPGTTEVLAKSVCVEFVDRQLQIDILGPTQRTKGSRAEFTFTLTNYSTETLTDVLAAVSHDQALVPREASEGKTSTPGRLNWDLGTLQPMESIQLQVDFECSALARRACISLDVRAAQISSEQDEACIEIVPLVGTLDLRLRDRNDPLEIAKVGRYEATVQNVGLQSARQVVLEATIPAQMKVVATKVLLGSAELSVTAKQQAERLVFDSVDDLAANAQLTYVVDVEPLFAGPAEVRVQVSSSLENSAVTTSEPTVIAEQ